MKIAMKYWNPHKYILDHLLNTAKSVIFTFPFKNALSDDTYPELSEACIMQSHSANEKIKALNPSILHFLQKYNEE